jgi:flavin reductase (DIM6/NTAB) family NADH-FMN oxidoreductase RutF
MTNTAVDIRNEGVDATSLRHALGRFATGVTVVTTRGPSGQPEGLTVNSFASLSLDPPLVLWSLKNTSSALGSFQAAEFFAVNVLDRAQAALCARFAKSGDKFAGVEHVLGLGGCPIFSDSLALFECRSERQIDGGDHVIFIGKVLRASYRDGEPLIFSAGQYCIPAAL